MNKNKNLFIWVAIGAALFFAASKKNSAEPVAAETLLPDSGSPTGNPDAQYLQPENVPKQPLPKYPIS